jgi:hypothetical protein
MSADGATAGCADRSAATHNGFLTVKTDCYSQQGDLLVSTTRSCDV